MNKTYVPKKCDQAIWFIVDARDQTLGRLSTQIAHTLKGKYSAYYTPYQISQSYIVIINASYIRVSGQKKYQKVYRRHSGRPGGLKQESFLQLQKRIPERIIEKAVKGMLPKNTLGRKLFTYLKVYSGPDHPHKAHKLMPLPTQF
jgi:large subunit ribosomal protein L13